MPARWTEYVPLDEVLRAPRNPKRHATEDLSASIARFGFVEAPTIDERTGRLVAGHGRLDELAARRRAGSPPPEGVDVDDDGAWLVPVQRGWSSADEAEAEAYVVTSNRLVEKGGWDLADLLDIVGRAPNLDGVGFSRDDLADLQDRLARENPPAPRADPDDADPAPAIPISADGDVWQLGPHRLVCGTNADPAVVDAAVAHRSVPILWTDPPYGVDYVGKTRRRLTVPGDTAGGLPELLAAAFATAGAHLAPGARVYVCGPSGPALSPILEAFQARWRFRQLLVWVKNTMVLGHSDYHNAHEVMVYGDVDPSWPGAYEPGHEWLLYGYNAGDGRWGRGSQGWFGDNSQTTVFSHPKPNASKVHPTMKPTALIEACLNNSSRAGDVVLDVFAGSGSTLIAAHLTGRVAACVERDLGYCDVICRRYQAVTGDVPLLVGRVVNGALVDVDPRPVTFEDKPLAHEG